MRERCLNANERFRRFELLWYDWSKCFVTKNLDSFLFLHRLRAFNFQIACLRSRQKKSALYKACLPKQKWLCPFALDKKKTLMFHHNESVSFFAEALTELIWWYKHTTHESRDNVSNCPDFPPTMRVAVCLYDQAWISGEASSRITQIYTGL